MTDKPDTLLINVHLHARRHHRAECRCEYCAMFGCDWDHGRPCLHCQADPLADLRLLDVAWVLDEESVASIRSSIDLIERLRAAVDEANGIIDVQREEQERLRERVAELEGQECPRCHRGE